MSDVPGIDSRERLATWLKAETGAGGLGDISLIMGGRSNLTYVLEMAAGQGISKLVLRRPPLGHVLPTAHDMSREFRILTALAPTEVPVPQPVAFCQDTEVIGAPFYIMRHVPGMAMRTREDTGSLSQEQAEGLSEQLVRMLAAIHSVDIEPLQGLGRGVGYLRRQLDRWQRQWQLSVAAAPPGDQLQAEYERLVARLTAALPPDGEVTLVHGDFRLDNTLVTIGPEPRIEAVVDWEMATLGDPLADLGLTLSYWTNPGEIDDNSKNGLVARSITGEPTATPGFFTRQRFAERYAELTGRDTTRVDYYIAFGCFKLAVVLQGIHARYLQHQTVGIGFEREGPAVPLLVARAHRTLDG